MLHMSSKMLHFVDGPTFVSLTDVGEESIAVSFNE